MQDSSEQHGVNDRDVWLREREFHDALAAPLVAAALPPAPPDALETVMLARLGPLAGKRVLELGCGAGGLTLQLLNNGADVTALDLSPGMVDIARRRVEQYIPRTRAQFIVAPVEHTSCPHASFDVVLGKWILHHADVRGAADEIARVLKPGGRGAFVENSGLNPLLMFARKYVAGRWGICKYGTDDEHPLVAEDYAYYKRHFRRFRLYYPDFNFFTLFDRNVLRHKVPIASATARTLDTAIWRYIPPLRRYSFRVIMEIQK